MKSKIPNRGYCIFRDFDSRMIIRKPEQIAARQAAPLILAVLCLLAMASFQGKLAEAAAPRFDFAHSRWDQLLKRHVRVVEPGRNTRVDYAGMQAEYAALREYLDELAEVSRSQFDAWPARDRLAFPINAYNAWTVDLILGDYPELESIRDLGSLFRSPWSRRFVQLFGDRVSLDYIEHELIRGRGGFAEPRIHFAVNCASIGCPALREEAFVGDRLDAQLEDATGRFLADRSRNRLEDGVMWVSELFDWYREDFHKNWRGTANVAQFLARYSLALQLPHNAQIALQQGRLPIRYLDYDWSLNALDP